MSPQAKVEVSQAPSESWNALVPSELTCICMTGRGIAKHNFRIYTLSCILCPWCSDSAHWQGVVSPPAPPQWIMCEHGRSTKDRKTSTPVENTERSSFLYLHVVYALIWSHFWDDFPSQADFFCFSLLPILLHPLSTTSRRYSSWIHARVHKSPICHDIWWTRHGLQESGPVWGCDLVSSLSASGSTGTEGRKGSRKGERGGTASVKGWELGAEEVGGCIHAAVWPWRQTGSPEIRGVINLSVEPANPTAPCPGNLPLLRWGVGLRWAKKERGNQGEKWGPRICFIKSYLSFYKLCCWIGDEASYWENIWLLSLFPGPAASVNSLEKPYFW